MRRVSGYLIVILAVVSFVLPPVAQAVDIIGATGRIVALHLKDTNATSYGQFHGWILVGDEVVGVQTYRWGGSWCAGFPLSAENLSVLKSGLDNPRLLIRPEYKIGQGNTVCLVAFTLFQRSDETLLP
jgi:hypothetical protein